MGKSTEKGKLDDLKKDDFDVKHVDSPDAIGTHEKTADENVGKLATSTERSASLQVVVQSFHWFNEAAQRKIETLRRDLKSEDDPDWFSQIATALLEIALGAGAAAAGVRLAQHFVPTAGEAGTEFVKVLFEGGIGAGVEAGRKKLAGGKDDHVIDPFIDAHKDGVEAAQQANQTKFIKEGQRNIKTAEDAAALEAACSRENVVAAAEKQYEATRDAWVSYLAQSKFGAVGKRGTVQPGDVNVGPTTTNMSTQEVRDRVNKSAPGFVPDEAPMLKNAVRGDVPGVLEVLAELPAIRGGEMDGKPKVELAFLNGVNGAIRSQFEGVPLAQLKIPRQVVARVDGAPDFTLNLDESGDSNYLDAKQRRWLAARPVVGHPEHAAVDEWERSKEGIRLLLADLVPSSIKKSLL